MAQVQLVHQCKNRRLKTEEVLKQYHQQPSSSARDLRTYMPMLYTHAACTASTKAGPWTHHLGTWTHHNSRRARLCADRPGRDERRCPPFSVCMESRELEERLQMIAPHFRSPIELGHPHQIERGVNASCMPPAALSGSLPILYTSLTTHEGRIQYVSPTAWLRGVISSMPNSASGVLQLERVGFLYHKYRYGYIA